MSATSRSNVLFQLSWNSVQVKRLIDGEPCLPLQTRGHDVVQHVNTGCQNLVVVHEEPPHVRNDLLGDVLGYLL